MSRIISLLITIPFLVYFALVFGLEGILLGIFNIALPMACIWFPDSLGSVTGVGFGRLAAPMITKESPGCLVSFMGWCLLLVVIATRIYSINAG
jgi:hypothetical protein